MKILLHSNVAAPSLLARYGFAGQRLREAGHVVRVGTGNVDPNDEDVFVSHNWIAETERQASSARCFGGKKMTRPESLTLLASLGVPTMDWTVVSDLAAAQAKFETWNVDRLILKRSFTGGGAGFHAHPHPPRLARSGDRTAREGAGRGRGGRDGGGQLARQPGVRGTGPAGRRPVVIARRAYGLALPIAVQIS